MAEHRSIIQTVVGLDGVMASSVKLPGLSPVTRRIRRRHPHFALTLSLTLTSIAAPNRSPQSLPKINKLLFLSQQPAIQ